MISDMSLLRSQSHKEAHNMHTGQKRGYKDISEHANDISKHAHDISKHAHNVGHE